METQTHANDIAGKIIQRLLDALHILKDLGIRLNKRLNALLEKMQTLQNHNPEYYDIEHNKRENMKISFRLFLILLSIPIDFLLVSQGVEILCARYHLSNYLVYVAPVILILLELLISYFQIIQAREGELNSVWFRNLQYAVLIMLLGLSLTAVVFKIEAYNPETENLSFVSYLISTLSFQVIMLCASTMLHLFLIKNAEGIAEAFAYTLYKFDKSNLAWSIKRLEAKINRKYAIPFRKKAMQLLQKLEASKIENPSKRGFFEKLMTKDLKAEINMLMGRKIFKI